MLFFLTRELWREVRHCDRARGRVQPAIWYWTPADFGNDIQLHSRIGRQSMTAVLARAGEETRGRPVSIVVASGELSEWFERIVECVIRHPTHPRISLMVTSCLDGPLLDRCRRFLAGNPALHERVSTFFLATRANSDLTALEPETVSADYRAFLRLLCEGREALANTLGIFREPVHYDGNGNGDGIGGAVTSSGGIVAALGIRTWFPHRDWVVGTARQLLANLVALETKQAAADMRYRGAGPGTIIGKALALGAVDEPLATRHFASELPELPEFAFENWSVPFSKSRARRERRELYREVEKDFTRYVQSLEETLAEIVQQIHRRSASAFSEAKITYCGDLLQGARLGDLALLAKDYFPAFNPDDRTSTHSPREGWLPDRSLDPFCKVYEAIDDGLHELPSRKLWAATIPVALGLLGLAFLLRGTFLWLPSALVPVALAGPAILFTLRLWQIRKMRGEVAHLWDRVYLRLRAAFDREIDWHLRETRCQLEYRIRIDATAFARRLREDLDSLPWLFHETERPCDELQNDVRRLRASLIDTGIDEHALDRLTNRLQTLAETIVERCQQDPGSKREGDTVSKAPNEIMDEWIDELVASTSIPRKNVNAVKEEVLEAAGGWRSPPLMAPLTDAELVRGYRKVIAIPDTDIAYQYLNDDIPRYSGNPVVSLKSWSGPLPGIAVCSVMTGLPDTILNYQITGTGNYV